MPKKARMSSNSKAKSKKATSKKSVKNKPCPQCQAGPEYYRMFFDQYKFDVDLARELTADEREPFLLEKDDVEHAVAWAHIHEPHLDHVDLKYPGIVAHYWYVTKEDELLHGTVLIDGHHRAARALRDDVPFYVRILSEDESKQITMREPESVLAKLK
jgi:hypothetical protein